MVTKLINGNLHSKIIISVCNYLAGMSAIFGIINKNGSSVRTAHLLGMSDAMNHRAKDGVQFFTDGDTGLGCCMMKVYDNNQYEKLPYESGGVVITASVQLHNREKLVKKLGLPAEIPDAYIVHAAYKHWNKQCVDHLEGEYVFAAWNKESKELFLATDHMGSKSLYYYDGPEQFIFSSEIKGIEAIKATANYIDEQVLIKKLLWENSQTGTYNKEVKRLLGGHYIHSGNNSVHVKQYWKFSRPYKYSFTKDEDWYECARELVYRCVQDRIQTKGKIGVKLSGGLDSSAVACVLSDVLQRKNQTLYAFSSVVSSVSNGVEDERKYIDIVAKHCPNMVVHYEAAEGLTPIDNIEKSILATEDYAHNILYMFIRILEVATAANISVLFTGYGGDQWISSKGNHTIYELLKQGDFNKVYSLIRAVSSFREQHPLITFRSEVLSKLKPASVYRNILNKIPESRFSFAKGSVKKRYQESFRENSPMIQAEHINKGIICHALQSYDQVTAYHGMVGVTSFLDKRIVEFMADVPLHLYMKGGYPRSFFRNSFEGILPKEIQWRFSKTGYSPDQTARLTFRLPELQKIFDAPGQQFFFEKYLSKEAVHHKMNIAIKHEGSGKKVPELLSLCNLALVLQSFHIFKKSKGYFFDY